MVTASPSGKGRACGASPASPRRRECSLHLWDAEGLGGGGSTFSVYRKYIKCPCPWQPFEERVGHVPSTCSALTLTQEKTRPGSGRGSAPAEEVPGGAAALAHLKLHPCGIREQSLLLSLPIPSHCLLIITKQNSK